MVPERQPGRSTAALRLLSNGRACEGRPCPALLAGFTLVEILIALVLLGVLASVLFPVVIQQIDRVPPVVVARDLRNIGTAVRTFHLNLRQAAPGDMEDLVHPIDGADQQANGEGYSARMQSLWNGPYIDLPLAEGGVLTGDAKTTGFGARIQNELPCFDADPAVNAEVVCSEGNGVFMAVRTTNILGSEFDRVNDVIDGEWESDALRGDGRTDARTQGRLRLAQDIVIFLPAEDGDMYYLIAPYTEP